MRIIGLQKFLKRCFDFVFGLFISIFAIPIVIFFGIVIKICSPEDSAFFIQKRIGYKCREFKILKLRTMTNERDQSGMLLSDEMRLKRWGKLIRKFSIDELPQIYNILIGQMSWIGPRPLLPREMLIMTNSEQKERQSFLPGITGWEAVNEDKSDDRRVMADFDLFYVRNWSLVLDLKIFIKTVKKLFMGDRSDDEHRAPKLKEEEIISNLVNEESDSINGK